MTHACAFLCLQTRPSAFGFYVKSTSRVHGTVVNACRRKKKGGRGGLHTKVFSN